VTALSAAILDFGDTLFHSPDAVSVLVEAGVEPGLAERLWEELWLESKSPEELAVGRDLSEAVHREAWLRLLARFEPHAADLPVALYDRVIHADGWVPYPDTAEVLAALHAGGVRVGVLSNVPTPLRPLFERHGLGPFVSSYVESFRHARVKPDPELFRIACRELCVAPDEALMVGDSHLADGAAVLAGLTALVLPAVPRGAIRGLDRVLDLCGRPRTDERDRRRPR
jgi:FMN phosphatase YigB (HAD superfamily)